MDTRFKVIFDNLHPFELSLIESMQKKAFDLCVDMQAIPMGRELSLALTNLEQAMMWAIKAVCLQSEKDK
ncbi:MAG: hypothetical protein WA324_27775 [Bryobacteraceae bacterium]